MVSGIIIVFHLPTDFVFDVFSLCYWIAEYSCGFHHFHYYSFNIIQILWSLISFKTILIDGIRFVGILIQIAIDIRIIIWIILIQIKYDTKIAYGAGEN